MDFLLIGAGALLSVIVVALALAWVDKLYGRMDG